MLLGQLYHWSPADRRASIAVRGLIPNSPQVTCTRPHPYICLSPDPLTAWRLSAQVLIDTGRIRTGAVWDLWQVTPADPDEIRVPPGYGPNLCEFQIHNIIPAGRAIYLAQRVTTTNP